MSVSMKTLLISLVFIVFLAGSTLAQLQLAGDLNSDYVVNSEDLRIFAWEWLDPYCLPPACKANIDGFNSVNMDDLALLANNWQMEELHIVISEFMASNIHAYPDGDGYYSDWIEIYNPAGKAVNLDGWYLTDDDANLIKWQFPDGLQLDPGEFLIVFASDKKSADYPNNYPYLDLGGYYHTNFNLDKDTGEYLALVAPDGKTVIHEYAPRFPAQLTDISYGLTQYSATLVPRGMTASYHVPTSGDAALGTGWAAADFNDSTWDGGKTGIGFGLGGERMVAYNDCVYRSDQYIANNVTTYCTGSGNPGPTSGPLVDQATGDNTGVTVTLTESGGVIWQSDPGNGGSDCVAGTDAYNTFGGMADMTGVIYYGSAGWWVELTFTGLDPTTDYTFATSAARNNYSGRLTIYTLTGADTYTNASTNGVDVLAENKVRFNTGDNHNEGYVARWTGITAANGSFTVRAEADPGNADGKAYSFDVFMLEGGSRGTDIQSDMLGVNSSLWMRTEFNLEAGDPEIFDTLTLQMKYEDGFVAYLNEQEVALRNAPNSVLWNSTALSNRPDANASVAEVFNIMSSVNALQAGWNVLAIHGLNDNATDPNFLILPDLTAASNMSVPQYFTTPTPRTFNVPGAQGVVGEVWYSHERGFYNTGFELILSTGDDDAEIRYTIDGSRPTITHGFTYSSPINVSGIMAVRAVAVKPGWIDSKVETHTYIFVNDVITQSPNGEAPGPGWPTGNVNGQVINYGMDPDVVLNDPRYVGLVDDALQSIATVSLVTDLDNMFDPSIGIWVNAGQKGRTWERPVSVELIYPPYIQGPGFPDQVQVRDPDGGIHVGMPADMRDGFQINAGMRIRGGYSVSDNNPKHAFRLFFRSEYGDAKLRYPLFGDEGVSEFDHVDLRCSQNYSWAFSGNSANTMVREVFSRDVQGMTGSPYTRSRYYHLYVNGHYWGLFQTQERAEASNAEAYLGGDKEDYDVVKTPGMQATDGNRQALDRLYYETIAGLDNYERYYRVQGLNMDGTPYSGPDPNYERLLDVDNVIDFMIIEYYTGDRDGPASRYTGRPNNTHGTYNRVNPDGWKWFHHDNEHSLGAGSAELNMVTPFSTHGANRQDFNPHWLHEQLANINVDYRIHFTDHVYRHFYNGGILSTTEAQKHIQNRANQIDMAIIAESARWGDSKVHPPRTKDDDWLPEIDDLLYDTSDRRHLTPRVEEVIGQFRSVGWYPNVNPPTFNQQGGEVPGGFNLNITASSGTICYTTNGSDPREPMTGNPVGTPSASPAVVTLSKSTHVKSRVLDGSTWSALNEAVFAIGPVTDYLRVTEIMYHPRNTGDANDPNEEFIELKNIGPNTLNLNLVRFTEGIDFTFPDMELEPDECVVVV
ncbi:MAG: lamin tail domain-containing protein, partial [Planctomycetota bacterium]